MAVRNVIFDLGGVLLEWNPTALLERLYPDAGHHRTVHESVFRHPDWRAFDRGHLTEEDWVARFCKRTSRGDAECRRLLDAIRHSLRPKADTVELLRALHARAVPLYCLSNMPGSVFAHVREACDFFDAFSGVVVSGHVKLAKPEREIYEHLLETYGLDAAQTVFIDDLAANVEAARSVGLQAIRFEDAAQCRRELAALMTDTWRRF